MVSKDGEGMIDKRAFISNNMKLKNKRTSYLKQKRDKSGRFGKKKPTLALWSIIKKWFSISVVLLFITGCAKYQVVQEVNLNMYHMHNPRTHKMEIILTKQKLEVGKYYRLKSIDTIEMDKK